METATAKEVDQPVLQAMARWGVKGEVQNGQFRALCPFHDEDTPSFDVVLGRGYWSCMGCGLSGNFVQLVKALAGLDDDLEALRLIRALRHEEPYVVAGPVRERAPKLAGSRELEDAWRRFHRVDWRKLPDGHRVKRYLAGRGFKPDALNAFDVRLTESMDYPLVVPIFRDKDLLGWAKRRVDDGKRKYLYNEGFDADSALAYYAFDKSPVVVVEGMFDLMKAAQHGARRGAALLGWRFSPAKVKWLKGQGVTEIVSALDNTDTGAEGTELLSKHFKVYRFKYPGSFRKDVCDVNQNEFLKGLLDALGH